MSKSMLDTLLVKIDSGQIDIHIDNFVNENIPTNKLRALTKLLDYINNNKNKEVKEWV